MWFPACTGAIMEQEAGELFLLVPNGHVNKAQTSVPALLCFLWGALEKPVHIIKSIVQGTHTSENYTQPSSTSRAVAGRGLEADAGTFRCV